MNQYLKSFLIKKTKNKEFKLNENKKGSLYVGRTIRE